MNLIDPFVQGIALGSKTIFSPQLLDVNKPELPLTEHDMLQTGNGNQVVICKHLEIAISDYA